jgi:hypothetical protein
MSPLRRMHYPTSVTMSEADVQATQEALHWARQSVRTETDAKKMDRVISDFEMAVQEAEVLMILHLSQETLTWMETLK